MWSRFGVVLCALGLVIGCGGEEEPGTLIDDGEDNQKDDDNDDDNDENGEERECPSGEFSEEGRCLAMAPQGTPPEECPSGEFRAHPSIDGEGICLPERPRGTPPEECPSGEFESQEMMDGEGVCLPERPRLEDWDCPDGWEPEGVSAGATDEAGTFDVCQPPDLAEGCEEENEWPSLRDGGCVQHGLECPEDEPWPSEPALIAAVGGFDGDVGYVEIGAESSETDGSRQHPFSTVNQGVSAASEGDIVALGKGAYVESVTVDDEIALVGACPSQTRVEIEEDSGAAIALHAQADAYVGHLTVEGGEQGLYVELKSNSADVVLDALVVEESGVSVSGSSPAADLSMRDLVLRGEDEGARGLEFSGSGAAQIDGAWLYTPQSGAMETKNGFELTVEDLWSEGVEDNTAVEARSSSSLSLQRVVLSDFQARGIVADWAEVELNDVYMATKGDGQWASYITTLFDGQVSGEQVRITGGGGANTRRAVHVGSGTSVDLERVAVHDIRRPNSSPQFAVEAGYGAEVDVAEALFVAGGLLADDADVTARDTVVRAAGDGVADRLENGLLVYYGNAKLNRVEFGGGLFEHQAVQLSYDARLHGSDLALRMESNGDEPTPIQHAGIVGFDVSQFDVERLLVDGAGAGGVIVSHNFMGRDVVIRNSVGADQMPWSGSGIVGEAGTIDLERFIITNNRVHGMGVVGGQGIYRDGVVIDTRVNESTGAMAPGGIFSEGADVEMNRLVFGDNVGTGMTVRWGVELNGEDIRISGVEPSLAMELEQDGDVGSFGVIVMGSRIDAKRWRIDDVRGSGMGLVPQPEEEEVAIPDNVDDTLSASLVDLVVEDLAPKDDEALSGGNGVVAGGASDLELSRGLITRTTTMGLGTEDVLEMSLRDLVIADIQGRRSDGAFGLGLAIMGDTEAMVSRGVVERSRTIGFAVEDGAVVEAEDLRISHTRSGDCGEETCEYPGGGMGVNTREEATMILDRFLVENSERVGVQVFGDSDFAARDGLIRSNQVGVGIHETSLSLDEAFTDVYLEDNQQNISSEEVEVPSMAGLLEEVSP